jgi:hypothetical protein
MGAATTGIIFRSNCCYQFLGDYSISRFTNTRATVDIEFEPGFVVAKITRFKHFGTKGLMTICITCCCYYSSDMAKSSLFS